MNKNLFSSIVFLFLPILLLSGWAQQNMLPYQDASLPSAMRAADLCSRMTLKEKVMQLNQYTLGSVTNTNNIGGEVKKIPAEIGSLIYYGTEPDARNAMQREAVENTRLGIPILFGYDVIHGFRTVFPVPLAQACSFNPELTRQSSRVAAQESRMSGIDWTFAPMIDVSRDPRWGRVVEGFGEDPYMNGVFGAAAVRGFQGEKLSDPLSIAACLKHFAGYGACEAGRDYFYTEISRQTLWDTYLQPYRMALEALPATVMSGFNNLSGIPVSGNRYLLADILKDSLCFSGFVVSDWSSIESMQYQGFVSDNRQAAEVAINAGLDMDMMSHAYDTHLEALIAEGKVDTTRLNDAVCRVLKVKFDLGLFEHPYTPKSDTKERFLLPDSRTLAEQCAEESMVLLKNEGKVLPLTTAKTIAVVGPFVEEGENFIGSWYGQGLKQDVTLLREAMTEEFKGKAQLLFAKGCGFDGNDESGFAEAQRIAHKADVVVVVLGEKENWCGENTSRAGIELPEIQFRLLRLMKDTGHKIVLVLSNGRPLQLNRIEPLADAILEMWQPGTPGAIPVARILSGKVNPSGKLAMTFPRTCGQIPIYYNRRSGSRPTGGFYHDQPSDPLFPFGYGLSYTQFDYSSITASKQVITADDEVTVSVSVTNRGDRDGKEAVLWYVDCPVAMPTRPVKELRYFEKRFIRQGATEVFEFRIHPMRDLAFVNDSGCPVLNKGKYIIHVGSQKLELSVK